MEKNIEQIHYHVFWFNNTIYFYELKYKKLSIFLGWFEISLNFLEYSK